MGTAAVKSDEILGILGILGTAILREPQANDSLQPAGHPGFRRNAHESKELRGNHGRCGTAAWPMLGKYCRAG